jgi:hypothetical protein
MAATKRFSLPEFDSRLLKFNGMPRVPVQTWTRQWNNYEIDVWVLTDDGELYYYPTTMPEFRRFMAPIEVKDHASLLRRVKHAWMFQGWSYQGKANPTPNPQGTAPKRP